MAPASGASYKSHIGGEAGRGGSSSGPDAPRGIACCGGPRGSGMLIVRRSCRLAPRFRAREELMYVPPAFREDRPEILRAASPRDRAGGPGELRSRGPHRQPRADAARRAGRPRYRRRARRPRRPCRAGQPAMAGECGRCPGARNLPRPGRLREPLPLRDQAGDRKGRSDLELCRRARVRSAYLLRRSARAPCVGEPSHGRPRSRDAPPPGR